MFDGARIRLTGWYLLILTSIVGVLSVLLFLLEQVQDDATHGGSVRWQLTHFFAQDDLLLAGQILGSDAIVLGIAAVGAYLLAGRTLRPIAEAMQRQERFAVAASHELRTPLTALSGHLELALLQPRMPEEYERVLAHAVEDIRRMARLVENLTLLARPSLHPNAMRHELVDVGAILKRAGADARPLAARKGQTLQIESTGELPIWGDGVKLRQVFSNLLENAIQYTGTGGRIRIRARQEQSRAVVDVHDTGKGIAAKDLPHIFDLFYQAAGLESRGAHAGLGLSIASWLVQAHGGKIVAQSQLGVGTTFTVSFPLIPVGTSRTESRLSQSLDS